MSEQQISIYRSLPDLLDKTICSLCEKAYKTGEKILLLVKDENQQEHINRILWTYSQKEFIPHGSSLDQVSAELQPIFITSEFQNLNHAKILITICDSQKLIELMQKEEFVTFKKVVIIANSNEINDVFLNVSPTKEICFYKQNNKGVWETERLSS